MRCGSVRQADSTNCDPLSKSSYHPSVAQVHTELPPDIDKHRGEHALAKRLILVEDPRLHLWLGLDSIPGVNDIDILIYHEMIGALVVR